MASTLPKGRHVESKYDLKGTEYRLNDLAQSSSVCNFNFFFSCNSMLWRSTLKSTGVGHFGAKFGKEGVDRCKPNFNVICERHGPWPSV